MASDSRWPRPTLWAALGPGDEHFVGVADFERAGLLDRRDFGQRLQKGFPEIVGGININEFERGNIHGNDGDFSEAEPAEVAGAIHDLEGRAPGLGESSRAFSFVVAVIRSIDADDAGKGVD